MYELCCFIGPKLINCPKLSVTCRCWEKNWLSKLISSNVISTTRVYYICFRNSSISLLLVCILILAYETTLKLKRLKHIVQKWKFQQSSTCFWVATHFLLCRLMRSLINQLYGIFGLNIPLLGKSRKCEDHGCVEFTTQ